MDSVFERWAGRGLVWLPEHGMGAYPVQENPYDEAYWQKYEAYAATELGRQLNEARLRLLDRYAAVGAVCDIGIGCGQFVAALRAAGRVAFGWDVNPTAIEWLREREWLLDPYVGECRAMTFWDSIEHIPDVERILARVGKYVFVSLPIFSDARHVLASKHFRKDEHVYYWTRSGFLCWMAEHSFRCIEHNTMESLLGREDVHSFVFERVARQ